MVERLQFICKQEGVHCPPAVLTELMARSEGAMLTLTLTLALALTHEQAHSQLPANPALPADLFSFCLTAPLRMALRHSCRNALVHASDELIDSLPG